MPSSIEMPSMFETSQYRISAHRAKEDKKPLTSFSFVPVAGGGAVLRVIQRVMAAISAVPRARKATEGPVRYAYRGIDDLLNALHGACAEHGLLIFPQVRKIDRTERETKSGGRACDLTVHFDYLLVAAEDGSSIEIPFVADATNVGDKALYVAYSMGMKYLLTLVFLVPTEDLAEGDAEVPVEVMPRAAAAPAAPSGIDLTDLKAALAGAATTEELKRIGTEIAELTALTEADRSTLRYVAAGRKSWLVQQAPPKPKTASEAKAALQAQMADRAADILAGSGGGEPEDLAAQMGVE